jgi:hypothetical protein
MGAGLTARFAAVGDVPNRLTSTVALCAVTQVA